MKYLAVALLLTTPASAATIDAWTNGSGGFAPGFGSGGALVTPEMIDLGPSYDAGGGKFGYGGWAPASAPLGGPATGAGSANGSGSGMGMPAQGWEFDGGDGDGDGWWSTPPRQNAGAPRNPGRGTPRPGTPVVTPPSTPTTPPLAPVPLPAPVLLLLAGLGALGVARRFARG